VNNNLNYITIAEPTLNRLPLYYQYLQSKRKEGHKTISGTRISEDLKLGAIQVRKDLQSAGVVGKPKTGYEIEDVLSRLSEFLGYDTKSDAILVGVGKLGKTILSCEDFLECGVEIVAAFDADPNIVGTEISGVQVLHISKLEDMIRRLNIDLGIITSSAEEANEIARRMYEGGITGIWNFAPVHIDLPEDVSIQNENFKASLSVLLSKINNVTNDINVKNNNKRSLSMERLRKFENVCEIINKYDNDKAKLIPILQEVQDEYRYLPEEVMSFIATSLGIPSGKVFGVASFYSHFTLKPKGKYVIKICDGTACHVKKSTDVLAALKGHLNLTDDHLTTSDMLFTVETVSCLGTCGLAPAMMINDDVHGLLTGEKAIEIIKEIQSKEVSVNE
jgi:NADH-quinone oxidoreductase subunit E